MTGKKLLEKLQSFSEEELSHEVIVCGADCMINWVEGVSIAEEEILDESDEVAPAGTIVIDW